MTVKEFIKYSKSFVDLQKCILVFNGRYFPNDVIYAKLSDTKYKKLDELNDDKIEEYSDKEAVIYNRDRNTYYHLHKGIEYIDCEDPLIEKVLQNIYNEFSSCVRLELSCKKEPIEVLIDEIFILNYLNGSFNLTSIVNHIKPVDVVIKKAMSFWENKINRTFSVNVMYRRKNGTYAHSYGEIAIYLSRKQQEIMRLLVSILTNKSNLKFLRKLVNTNPF